MTETPNFKLKKPGLTDPVDINVLNENFDIIDDEMAKGGILDIDLTVSVDLDISASYVEFDITSIVEMETVLTAVDAGKIVRIWCKDSTRGGEPFSILLADHYTTITDEAKFSYLCGMASDPYVENAYSEYVLIDTNVNGTHTAKLRHYVFENGSDEQFVKLDLSGYYDGVIGRIYADGGTSNLDVTFDEQGRPIKFSNGAEEFEIVWPAEETTEEVTS